MKTKKIGAVSYLNTVPLIEGLQNLAPDYQVCLDLPSRLATRLAAGELDVALIPTVEALRAPHYRIISDACIACCGPVWSVKILSRVPLEQVRSISLDEGSRTSVALTKILLHRRFGIEPEYQTLRMQDDFRTTTSDAVLIIGDRAMHFSYAGFPYVFDLGEVWYDWTKLPFVFAVWAARADADWTDEELGRLSHVFSRSRNQGLAAAMQISARCAGTYGLTLEQCRKYLTWHLHYHLGSAEKQGLKLFSEYAAEMALIPHEPEIRFHDLQVA